MSTNNHTAIATGAAANAGTINAPLGQLDAAIGAAVTTLSTTAKTVVGAVNELDAQVDVSINADGTIKAAAVVGALSSPNTCFDPHNRYYAPGTALQDGRDRWYNAASLSQVSPDAANPYGLPTVRCTGSTPGNSGGRRVYLDEAGLKVGDVVSMGALLLCANTRTFKVNYTFRTSAGAVISAVAGTSRVGTGVTALYAEEGVTIPATTYSVDIYLYLAAGTGDIDVYGWYLVRGAVLQSITTQGESDGQRALAQIQAALAGSANLTGRFDRLPVHPVNEPFSRYYPVSTIIQDDHLRWYNPANIVRSVGDVHNPFGTPTLTVAPSASHRYVLSEMGLSVGDTLSFAIVGWWDTGTNYKIAYAFRTSAGAVVTSASAAGAGVGGNGICTPIYIELEGITVPATAVYLDVYPFQASGSSAADIYGTYIVKAATISEADCMDYGYSQRYAPGGWAVKRETLSPIINAHNLSSWRQVQSQMYNGTVGKVARIACIGDSITNLYSRWFMPFTLRAAAELGRGMGGVGWISVNATAYNALVGMPMYTGVSRAGTWTDHDMSTTPRGMGYDGYDALCTVNGGKYTITAEMSSCDIHYIKDPAGGTLRYRVDGGAWSADVHTNGVAAAAVETIAGLDGKSHAVEVEVNAQPVILAGFAAKVTTTANRLSTHKAGYSGANATDWATTTSQAVWKGDLTLLDPQLVIVWLGTNNSGTQSTYKASLKTIITNCRAALPTTDILLISPYEPGAAHSYDNQGYADRVRELANEYNYVAGLDMSAYIDYAKISAGSFTDTVHVNEVGGAIAAGAILQALSTGLTGDPSTYWDDIQNMLIGKGLESPGSDVVVNIAEGSVDYKVSAALADYVVMNIQQSHKWAKTSVRVHLHWWQPNANLPNWMIQYRWQNLGTAKTTAWTNKIRSGEAFAYVSGTLNQITEFGTITPPAGAGISDILQVRLIRDRANASGLFAGADTTGVTVSAVSLDEHYEADSAGSRDEYAK